MSITFAGPVVLRIGGAEIPLARVSFDPPKRPPIVRVVLHAPAVTRAEFERWKRLLAAAVSPPKR